jgi:predicted AlkP superfamily phosphohydrolase/phosphomutase
VSARALVLGLDGATWNVLEPLAGRLPNLKRLWESGARAPLNSTTPPMTLPAWSSFLTGANPGKHGIFDFTRRVPGTYRLEFVNSTHRRVPTLHRLLSDRGRRVASIAVPTTYPPEPLDGVMISGFDSPIATGIEPVHCHPRALHDELVGRFGRLAFADFQEGDIGPGWHAHAHASLLREIARKEAICAHLLDRERWDAFMVVFGESDTAAHHFWMFHDPASPRFRPGMEDKLAEVYVRLDAAVGVLAAKADRVCIVSDHGFGGAGDLVLYLNRFLEAHGWLRSRGRAGAGLGATLGEAARRAAMRLPLERVLRRVPPGVLGRVESAARYADIDFAGTRAWSDEMNYAATIHLNVRGRDPLGTIDDVDAAAADLTRLLLGWEVEGRKVVTRVWRRDEIFTGECVPSAPDLVLELALRDGYSVTLLPSVRAAPGQTWRRLTRAEHVGGKGLGMNGSHRQHGVLVLAGDGVRPGVTTNADIVDPMPTLLHLLGEPIPAHVDGRVLTEVLTDSRAPTRSRSERVAAPTRPLDRGEAAELRQRLEKLGYL